MGNLWGVRQQQAVYLFDRDKPTRIEAQFTCLHELPHGGPAEFQHFGRLADGDMAGARMALVVQFDCANCDLKVAKCLGVVEG